MIKKDSYLSYLSKKPNPDSITYLLLQISGTVYTVNIISRRQSCMEIKIQNVSFYTGQVPLHQWVSAKYERLSMLRETLVLRVLIYELILFLYNVKSQYT